MPQGTINSPVPQSGVEFPVFTTDRSLLTELITLGYRNWLFYATWPILQIPGRGIPKTEKIGPDATLLKIQHYKVRIKGKVEQSREWSSALSNTSV